jgi:hypothetical protein
MQRPPLVGVRNGMRRCEGRWKPESERRNSRIKKNAEAADLDREDRVWEDGLRSSAQGRGVQVRQKIVYGKKIPGGAGTRTGRTQDTRAHKGTRVTPTNLTTIQPSKSTNTPQPSTRTSARPVPFTRTGSIRTSMLFGGTSTLCAGRPCSSQWLIRPLHANHK